MLKETAVVERMVGALAEQNIRLEVKVARLEKAVIALLERATGSDIFDEIEKSIKAEKDMHDYIESSCRGDKK